MMSVLLLVPALGSANEPTAPVDVAVPPGQGELLANMLGLGAPLPGPCKFADGQANGPVIQAIYDCPAGKVVLELRHPRNAPAPAAQTDKFAIIVLSGSLPTGLLDALRSRIGSREGAFEWMLLHRSQSSSRPLWLVAGECFFLTLLGGVVAALWRSRRHIFTRAAVTPALLAVLALGLRFIAQAGPADIRAVLDERAGPARAGWVAFVQLAYEVLPRLDETIWTINRIVGALSVPLLYVVMRRRFADPLAAVAGAAALAVTPLITRFSASDTPYILLCAALLGALVAYDRYMESGSMGAMALALGLLIAAMQLRPETSWLIVPAILLALARPSPGWRTRLLRPSIVIAALLFLALNAIPIVWAMTGHRQYWNTFVLVGSVIGSPWESPDMTPAPLRALVVLGAFSALFYQLPGLLWLAAVLVAEPFNFPVNADYPGHACIQYANARYHFPAMYLACGLAGLGVALVLRLLGRLTQRKLAAANLTAVCILGLAALPRFDLLRRMWTPQREYQVFRDGLTRIDPNCRVVTLENTRDSGWAPFEYLVPGGLLDIPEFLADTRGSCFVYYRCGNCYTSDLVPDDQRPNFQMNPACAAIEQRFRLEPIIEVQVPALPYRGEVYARDPLPLGFYRLHERTPMESLP